jgi:hypothetical protein
MSYWRSAAAIAVAPGVMALVSDLFTLIGAVPVLVGLDWATARRRQFAR